MIQDLSETIAAIIDPQAWTDRGKRSDVHRRTHSRKKARRILEALGEYFHTLSLPEPADAPDGTVPD